MTAKKIIQKVLNTLPPSWRMNMESGYRSVYRFYSEAQFYPVEKIEAWQLERLKRIVSFAYEHAPGYRQLYSEAGITPRDIRSLADIRNLPFTEKALLQNNLKEFTALPPSKVRYCTTGGSTGVPFGFYVGKKNSAAEYGFMHNAWEETGWRINDLGVTLRGGYVGDAEHLFHKDGCRRYSLSTYQFNDGSYERYRDYLHQLRPSFLHAYPSSAADLANLVIHHHDEGTFPFRSIFLGSENLYPWQIELIRKAFPAARIMCWYGHTERAIWAPWCQYETQYHVNPFYGYTEVLRQDNREANRGERGELVGTAFWMYGTPFIRYRTMDYAIKGKFGCEKCGRQFQLLEQIDGRLQEIIVSKRGRRISMTAINMHDVTFDAVAQFRFVQDQPGEIVLNVVPRQGALSDSDANRIRNSIQSKLGDDFSLTLLPVSRIPRSKSGKFSFLEQRLNIERSDRLAY